MTLAEFLAARLGEREAIATAAGGDTWRADDSGVYHEDAASRPGPFAVGPYGYLLDEEAAHIALNDPDRALREVRAMRRRLERYLAQDGWDLPAGVHDGRDPDERECDEAVKSALETEVREDAAVWSDHPDFDPGWKPSIP